MLRRTLGWIVVAAVSSSGACAKNRASVETGLGEVRQAPMVTVRNDNWLDVAVYVVHGTSRFRIGTVSSTSSQTFRLTSESLAGAMPLQILADPIGDSRSYVTEPVQLSPGQRLELKVGSPISISSFAVWNR